MTVKEAYIKLDNTLCLNSSELEFGVDIYNHEDCADMNEMIDALETLKKYLETNIGSMQNEII